MLSAKKPCKTGIIAPPTMAVQSIPDPCPVCFPNPAIARVKIVGNIMELNNPTAKMLHIAKCPLVSIEITTSDAALTASIAKVLPGFCLPRLNAIKFRATKTRNVKVLPKPESEVVIVGI